VKSQLHTSHGSEFFCLSHFEIAKLGLCDHLAGCVIRRIKPTFRKPGMHITAPEPISMAYFISPSHQSVCISLLSLPGNNSVDMFPCQRIIIRGVFFYLVCITLKENRRLVIPRTPVKIMVFCNVMPSIPEETSSGVHPAYTVGTRGSLAGGGVTTILH
jgi:hypothetical protein